MNCKMKTLQARAKRIGTGAGFLLALLPAIVVAQDVTHPPSSSDRSYAAKLGGTEAAKTIGAILRAAWKPGRLGLAGSSGNPAFQSWLLMTRWAQLLSREESHELARFMQHGLLVDDRESEKTIRFLPPGYHIPPDAIQVGFDDALKIVSSPAFDMQMGSYFLPPGFHRRQGTLAARVSPEFAAAMMTDEKFLRVFFGNISDDDFTPAVLDALSRIYSARPEKWSEYQSLAIALALVFDQRLPDFWPHHQVAQDLVPRALPDILEAFDFWVTAQESRATLNDIRKLEPDALKFIVDAPVEFSELTWAQQNVRFPRTDWERAFSSIAYTHDRIAAQQYDWQGSRYLLDEIQTRGGICVDQAYFAMLSGKARGLPTLYFAGQGSDGGHAWFGYLRGEGRWDLDCGRYENQNYAVGEALDPQSWRYISDHELENLARSFRRSDAYVASSNDVFMAEMFESHGAIDSAAAALESAIATSPKNPDAWQARAEFLARHDMPMDIRVAHHEAALKQFPNDNDLRVHQQRALASLASSSGDAAKAEQLQKAIIRQNSQSRSDISVQAAAESIRKRLTEDDVKSALKELRNVLSRLGKTAGGNIFYEIVKPTVWYLRENGEPDLALRVIGDSRRAIDPDSGGILDVDFSKLEADDPSARR